MEITKTALVMALSGGVIGAICGVFIPLLARKLVNKKNRLRQKPEMPDILKKGIHRGLIIAADVILSGVICLLYPGFTGILWVLILQNVIICVLTDHFIRIIANEEVLIILVLAIVLRIQSDGVRSLLGALGAMGVTVLVFGGTALVMMKLRGTPGVGAGDLKYAMALSIALGWHVIGWFFAGMAAALILICVWGMKTGKLAKSSYFPMCPEISVGFLAAVILPLFSDLLTM